MISPNSLFPAALVLAVFLLSAPMTADAASTASVDRRAGSFNVVRTSVSFLLSTTGTGVVQVHGVAIDDRRDVSDEERKLYCSIQKILSRHTSDALRFRIADDISPLVGRSAEGLRIFFSDPAQCVTEEQVEDVEEQVIPFRVDAKGLPLSNNPTWNACIRGTVTLKDIRNNPDTDDDGVGRDCSFYHTYSFWKHPDLGITFRFDRKYKLLKIPKGYVISRVNVTAKQ